MKTIYPFGHDEALVDAEHLPVGVDEEEFGVPLHLALPPLLILTDRPPLPTGRRALWGGGGGVEMRRR